MKRSHQIAFSSEPNTVKAKAEEEEEEEELVFTSLPCEMRRAVWQAIPDPNSAGWLRICLARVCKQFHAEDPGIILLGWLDQHRAVVDLESPWLPQLLAEFDARGMVYMKRPPSHVFGGASMIRFAAGLLKSEDPEYAAMNTFVIMRNAAMELPFQEGDPVAAFEADFFLIFYWFTNSVLDRKTLEHRRYLLAVTEASYTRIERESPTLIQPESGNICVASRRRWPKILSDCHSSPRLLYYGGLHNLTTGRLASAGVHTSLSMWLTVLWNNDFNECMNKR